MTFINLIYIFNYNVLVDAVIVVPFLAIVHSFLSNIFMLCHFLVILSFPLKSRKLCFVYLYIYY